MYKAKHGLILGNKYLSFWQKGLGQTGGEKKKEEKRRRREVQERSKVWITMGLYGFLWLGMTVSCYKPRV